MFVDPVSGESFIISTIFVDLVPSIGVVLISRSILYNSAGVRFLSGHGISMYYFPETSLLRVVSGDDGSEQTWSFAGQVPVQVNIPDLDKAVVGFRGAAVILATHEPTGSWAVVPVFFYLTSITRPFIRAAPRDGGELGPHPRQQLLQAIFHEEDRFIALQLIQRFIDESPVLITDLDDAIEATINGDVDACP